MNVDIEAWQEASRILRGRHREEFEIILERKIREVEKNGGIKQ